MIPLYTNKDFEKSKLKNKLPLQCVCCKKTFYITKKIIKESFRNSRTSTCEYCSRKCSNSSRNPPILVKCKNCDKEFKKLLCEIKKTKNNFCRKSCAAIYNNAHKTKGTRVSKLEIWLQKQLTILYPQLEIHYNRKDAINSELDIYIPSLKLAFELNGIFHYEPIYGEDKLKSIQNNDNRKFQACIENKIELCLIDTSTFNYFKQNIAKKYLEIIIKIIGGASEI